MLKTAVTNYDEFIISYMRTLNSCWIVLNTYSLGPSQAANEARIKYLYSREENVAEPKVHSVLISDPTYVNFNFSKKLSIATKTLHAHST